MQKPCNYYDKYIKYKKKYIDYKNKLLDMKGGGIDSYIRFYTVQDDGGEQHVSSADLPSFLNGNDISKLHIKILYLHDNNLKFIAYRFIKKVGSGSYGDVYQIEQVEPVPQPVPQPGSPNFVIKLNIKKRDKKYNMDEGLTIDKISVSPSVKAIFQGWAGNIDYAIYNYLGQDLETFFRVPKNLVGFTQKQMMSLIRQLHTQLYALNSNNQFHNDVKTDNIVMRKMTDQDQDKYELSLIDYGLLSKDNSNRGSLLSMCIRGCAQYLYNMYIELYNNNDQYVQLFNSILQLFSSTSTDYVGFFHVIVFLLNPMYDPVEIYREIFGLTQTKKEEFFTTGNIYKVLCLLCYVSGCSDKTDVDTVDEFLNSYPITVAGIDKVLKDNCTGDNLQKFTSFIPGYVKGENTYTERRLLFLYFIYSKIIVGYHTFIPIVQIPLFLWKLSCCFDFRFNLEQFNTNFDAIFTHMPIEIMPLNTFFSIPKNLVGFTQEHMMSLIRQLQTQLHILNSTNRFYNDVKIDNIVMCKLTGSDEYELSLIDSKLLTKGESNRGSFQSMCIRGFAQFLFNTYKKVNTSSILPLFRSTSTDYVGFFHVVIFLLNPTYKPSQIYEEILDLKPTEDGIWNTVTNIYKVLCLLCYVSGCSDKTDVDTVDEFLRMYPSTVAGIDKVLKDNCTGNNLQKFTSVIPGYKTGENTYTERRLLFLYFIYSKIIVGYHTFIPIVQIPLFLWRLSCCFDFRFNLEQFNTNFDAIFTPMPIETMPLNTFFSIPKNLVGFTQEHMMSLIGKLHTQLHILNSTNRFYNDVKIDNIVMCKLTGSDEYELSLIDSKLLTKGESNRGSFVCMCIRGCTQYLYDIYIEQKVNTSSIEPLFGSTSTDYVGFFHAVVFLLNPTYKPFDIYRDILGLTSTENEVWYTSDNICKVLCLLCYVSICYIKTDEDRDNAFLRENLDTVTRIDEVLKDNCTGDNFQKFTSVIPGYDDGIYPRMVRRLQFLYFIYSKIIEDYGAGYPTFIPKESLPLFLWNFSCCFDFRFNLNEFNKSMN